MNHDKITPSVNQYGSYTKPIDDFDKYIFKYNVEKNNKLNNRLLS
jgi:hypothetical protein